MMTQRRLLVALLAVLAIFNTSCGTNIDADEVPQPLISVNRSSVPEVAGKVVSISMKVRRHCLQVTDTNPLHDYVLENVLYAKDIRYVVSVKDYWYETKEVMVGTKKVLQEVAMSAAVDSTVKCQNLNQNFLQAIKETQKVDLGECTFPEPAANVLRIFTLKPAMKHADNTLTAIGAVEEIYAYNGAVGEVRLLKAAPHYQVQKDNVGGQQELSSGVTYQVSRDLDTSKCDVIQ